MRKHLNTLYVASQGAYLAKDGEAVAVKLDGKLKLRVPVHNLEGIVCFGNVICSPFLLGHCARAGVTVSFLSRYGRFLARVVGPTRGNVLLRREQYRQADDPGRSAALARNLVIAKLANSRSVLLRWLRDYPAGSGRREVAKATRALAAAIRQVRRSWQLDEVRGLEGAGALEYFSVFDRLIVTQKEHFQFLSRSRRPPLDRVNALLSFLYTLLLHDLTSALESVGLDPAVGFLHRDRPGRPSLALDLMEELRAYLADRSVLSLINLRKIKARDFSRHPNGAFLMTDEGRKKVLEHYQKRKDQEIVHPFLEEKTCVGRVVHLQALLLARFLRGDLDEYPPFLMR